MRPTLHFFVRFRAYFHLVKQFRRSFYSFPIISLLFCSSSSNKKNLCLQPLFWLSVPFNYFRHYCQSVIRIHSFLKRHIDYSLSIRLFHFGTNHLQFWYFSVFVSWAYIIYDWLSLVVSTGKTGVLQMIKKNPLRFHSFMSPFWLTSTFCWYVSYSVRHPWQSISKTGG